MSAYDLFVGEVHRQMALVETTQRGAIENAARWVSKALQGDRFFWAFGTGHSHMVAEEIFYRAGGLARGAPILEDKLMLHDHAIEATYLERESGYAARILANYPLSEGDVLSGEPVGAAARLPNVLAEDTWDLFRILLR